MECVCVLIALASFYTVQAHSYSMLKQCGRFNACTYCCLLCGSRIIIYLHYVGDDKTIIILLLYLHSGVGSQKKVIRPAHAATGSLDQAPPSIARFCRRFLIEAHPNRLRRSLEASSTAKNPVKLGKS